ncbi:hypothetical protein ILYODFUR_021235 [Ilyodon furcidens]|uniref:Uncharacterized protein n=1 Tax=Ilyodon furcidens TaxID=33524 RepID=A0ABV0UWP6_9TELE
MSSNMTMTRSTQPGQLRSGSVRSISRSWSGLATGSRPEPNQKSLEGAESPYCPVTALKPEGSGEDLYGGVVQNPCCSVCKLVKNYRKHLISVIANKGFGTK